MCVCVCVCVLAGEGLLTFSSWAVKLVRIGASGVEVFPGDLSETPGREVGEADCHHSPKSSRSLYFPFSSTPLPPSIQTLVCFASSSSAPVTLRGLPLDCWSQICFLMQSSPSARGVSAHLPSPIHPALHQQLATARAGGSSKLSL